MKVLRKREGFTLVEVMVTIAVLAVLGAGLVIAADEAVTTAKATKIINNLHTIQKALWTWCVDNHSKIQKDGRITIITNPNQAATGNDNTKPIQEWKDNYLQLGQYIERLAGTGINLNTKQTVTYIDDKNQKVTKINTSLTEGYYGICDAGNGKRNIWYAGYRFTKDEKAVKKKIQSRLKSEVGLWIGTADAHENPYEDNDTAVWLRVR